MLSPTYLDRLLDRDDPLQSYLSDLERLLNQDTPVEVELPTRIHEQSDRTYDEAKQRVCELVIQRIRNFDPRVSDVQVEPVSIQHDAIHLRIVVTMHDTADAESFSFFAETDGDLWTCSRSNRHEA